MHQACRAPDHCSFLRRLFALAAVAVSCRLDRSSPLHVISIFEHPRDSPERKFAVLPERSFRPNRERIMPKSLVLALTLTLSACSSDDDDPANAAGSYTLALTYGQNGCSFQDWQEGDTVQNVPLVIEQDGEAITGRIEGFPGIALGLIHGTNEYVGSIDGDRIVMRIEGTVPQAAGNCTFTWNNEVTATVDGDFLTGKSVFTPAKSDNSDCSAIECTSEMSFNGTRPPPG
jgi:hypothetical protein